MSIDLKLIYEHYGLIKSGIIDIIISVLPFLGFTSSVFIIICQAIICKMTENTVHSVERQANWMKL